MTETEIARYWIAASVIIVLLVLVLILQTTMRKSRMWSRSIGAHLLLVALFCGLVAAARESSLQLLADYGITFISRAMVNAVALFAVMVFITQQIFQLINRLTQGQIRRGSDPTSARMVSRILKCAILLLIMLLFGEHFGIGPSGLLAFGGIGGIALGVAGRDVLSNLFSGVMLYFDRPFSIGDWISSPDRDIEGTVVEIGWRLTHIMTFDNRPLHVPNSLFSTISVENPGQMTNRRINTTIGLRYEDSDRIGDVVEAIRTMLRTKPEIDGAQTLLVYFDGFGDSSLNVMVYCFTKTTKWSEWLSIQQEVYLSIVTIVHDHGADFAFPSRTLYLQKEDERQANPVSHP